MSEMSDTVMYRIINQSLKGTGNSSQYPVDTEMTKFGYEYHTRLKENIQLSLFDEHWPVKEDVRKAVGFCNCLEQYRQATDVYAKEPPELSAEVGRRLLEYIQYFRPYITEENLCALNGIESSVKRYLPEYRPMLVLEDFNCKAELILQDKKKQKRLKQKKEPYSTRYEQRAVDLLKEITFSDDLKQIEPCREKIQLLQNCLLLIDCLPAKFKRTKKFQFKCSVNAEIAREARLLSPPDLTLAQKAHEEELKYHNAIEKALSYADSYTVEKRRRDQRYKDEWTYH